MEIQVGSIVYSKAGRDKQKMLLVVELEKEYAYVADGVLRKIEKLKKKKLMHLQKTNMTVKFERNNLTNAEVRKILVGFKPNN